MNPSVPEKICPPAFDKRSFGALYESASDAVFVMEIETRCVAYWNQRAEALFGYRSDEVLQQTAEMLFTDASSFNRLYDVAIPEIERRGFWRGESEYRRRDASRFTAEAVAILPKPDRAVYVTFVVRDPSHRVEIRHESAQSSTQRVTERSSELVSKVSALEKTANERRQTEKLLEILLRNLSDYVILVLNAEGYVLHGTRGTERILGYTAEAVERMHLTDFYRVERKDKWRNILERAKVQNGFRDYDWLLRGDGSRFYARVEVLPLRDDSGALNGYMILLRDDTEQRKIRERLKDKEHMAAIGTATAMLAHEIKNPLNGISTTVQLLERSLRNDTQPSKEIMIATIRDLKSEIARLQSLLGDFQAISHPQRLNLQSVELPPLLRELISLVIPESLKKKIKIVEDYPNTLPAIDGDADKLKQAFINLIKNACEAMPDGGTLTTRAYLGDEGVCLEIIDTGEGIPPDLNVFELFSSTKADGTGLGLVIVRQIILAHNGSIEYSSDPGVATTFRVTLPVHSRSS
jgi:PAS domain S-box-containing protein